MSAALVLVLAVTMQPVMVMDRYEGEKQCLEANFQSRPGLIGFRPRPEAWEDVREAFGLAPIPYPIQGFALVCQTEA